MRTKSVHKSGFTTKRSISLQLLWLLTFLTVMAQAKQPASLKVITSGGFAAAYTKLAPGYERDSGIKLDTHYGSSSGGAPDSIPERLKQGQTFDVMILSKSSLTRLSKQQWVLAGTQRDMVKSMIGMAVKSGAPIPDIRTKDAFIQTLLNAKSIGYSASASGTYLSQKLWPKMDLWPELQPKSQRILSKRVASVVASGEVEIGFQQISEILPIEGAQFAGAIPDELQKVTVFSAAVLAHSEHPEAAKALIRYLSSKQVREKVRATGLTPFEYDH